MPGGYIFTRNVGNLQGWDYLRNFTLSAVSGLDDFSNGGNRFKGQYTTQHPPNFGLYNGNSLMVGDVEDRAGVVRKLVVAGTLGGFVYAFDPDESLDGSNGLVYELVQDLGWGVMGLDIGNVDGASEPDPEIVVSVWLGTGDYQNWVSAGDDVGHRGRIIILDPNPATGKLDIQEEITLAGGAGPDKFSVGVLGLKIDDVDGDGQAEIWCGDGAGRLFCLNRPRGTQDSYGAFFRSETLGTYPGLYNTIFPVKTTDGQGHTVTTSLVVFTPGYVYRFNVNSLMVP